MRFSRLESGVAYGTNYSRCLFYYTTYSTLIYPTVLKLKVLVCPSFVNLTSIWCGFASESVYSISVVSSVSISTFSKTLSKQFCTLNLAFFISLSIVMWKVSVLTRASGSIWAYETCCNSSRCQGMIFSWPSCEKPSLRLLHLFLMM